MKVSSDEESAHLISSAERFQRSQISKQTGRHKVFAFHQRSGLCSLSAHENYWSSVQEPPEARGDCVHHPQKFRDATKADYKVLNEENESSLQQHRHAVVALDLYSYWIQSFPTKTKIAQETMNYLQKFGITHTENSLEFIRASEDSCWNHDK